MDIELDIDGAEEAIAEFETMSEEVPDEVVYAVGSPLEYSKYQEFGTRFHPPQPYLRPATEQTKANLAQIIARSDDFESAMEDIAGEIRDEAKARAPVRTGRLQESIESRRVK